MRDGRRPLRLIYVFSPGSCLTRGGLVSFAGRPSNLGLSMSDRAAWVPEPCWGLIGVGHFSCVTPSSVFATGGVELTTLASMARVLRSMSSLTGTFVWNPGPSFADGIGRACWWHFTFFQPASRQMPEPFRWAQGGRWPLLGGDSMGLARG